MKEEGEKKDKEEGEEEGKRRKMNVISELAGRYLTVLISYPLVQFFSLQNKEPVSLCDDTTLLSNGPRCLHIVPCHHTHCDPRILTPLDTARHLSKEEMRGREVRGRGVRGREVRGRGVRGREVRGRGVRGRGVRGREVRGRGVRGRGVRGRREREGERELASGLTGS